MKIQETITHIHMYSTNKETKNKFQVPLQSI